MPDQSKSELKVNEIFFSIQGESLLAGKPSVFVRTTGCPLRCDYCDTKYAYYDGKMMPIDDILAEIRKYGSQYVCITGGEPLAQAAGSIELMKKLLDENFIVSLETSGSYSVKGVPEKVIKVIDIKCPDSGESEKMVWENVDLVTKDDQFKFVISSRKDFEWARKICNDYKLESKCTILFSPAYGTVSAKDLASWILDDRAPVTMQVQMHKEIWGPDEKGV